MPLNRKQRRARVKRVDIVLDELDVKFWIDYRPGTMTVEFFDELRMKAGVVETAGRTTDEGQAALDTIATGLEQVLADWDVVDEDEDGNEYHVQPTSTELRRLELPILLEMINQIFGEESVGKPSRRDSGGTSRQKDETVRSLPGTGSFE